VVVPSQLPRSGSGSMVSPGDIHDYRLTAAEPDAR
jgi:hypothetical protein